MLDDTFVKKIRMEFFNGHSFSPASLLLIVTKEFFAYNTCNISWHWQGHKKTIWSSCENQQPTNNQAKHIFSTAYYFLIVIYFIEMMDWNLNHIWCDYYLLYNRNNFNKPNKKNKTCIFAYINPNIFNSLTI